MPEDPIIIDTNTKKLDTPAIMQLKVLVKRIRYFDYLEIESSNIKNINIL